MTTSALAVSFVSLARAFTAWAFSGILQPSVPLTPPHGWLLPVPVRKPAWH